MGHSYNSHQPLHHRVCAVKGVAMVHALDGEDAVGCRASGNIHVQHPAVSEVPSHILYVEQRYVVRYKNRLFDGT